MSLTNGPRSLIRTITQLSRQTVTCVPNGKMRCAAVIAEPSLATSARGTLLKAKAATAQETVTAAVKLIVLSALPTVGDMTINPPCNATMADCKVMCPFEDEAIAASAKPHTLISIKMNPAT